MAKAKLSKEQKAALAAYEYALRQEDEIEAKTRTAYERCKALGMGVEHGL